MKLALTVDAWVDEELIFAQQLGVTHVLADPPLPLSGSLAWDERSLAALRNRVEKAGLELAGLERLPHRLDRTPEGEREAALETVCRLIRSAGAAGIRLLGYDWPSPAGRPERRTAGRGGARCAAYTRSGAPPPAAAGPQWDILSRFLERALPAAEAAGVRLACRPGDPLADPEASILGTGEGARQLMERFPSPCHGLDLSPAVAAAAPDADLPDLIRSMGSGQRIFLVAARNIRGTFPSFSETFPDEGDIDLFATLLGLQEAGFDGVVRPGPQPAMVEDTGWGHKAQGFAVGYLRALLQAAAV
jgi:mannonate dehydratase